MCAQLKFEPRSSALHKDIQITTLSAENVRTFTSSETGDDLHSWMTAKEVLSTVSCAAPAGRWCSTYLLILFRHPCFSFYE
ncbi:hypothetical protein SprV_0100343000 [Sparganum proliferum]